MTEESEHGPVRLRASRACQTCSLRKVRCDATEVGTPCSRCRVDQSPNCVLLPSKRGTYARQSRLQSPYERVTSKTNGDTVSKNTRCSISPPSNTSASSDECLSSSESTSLAAVLRQQSLETAYQNDMPINSAQQEMAPLTNTQTMKSTTVDDTGKTYEIQNFGGRSAVLCQDRDSLTSMFERFLEQRNQNPEDATAKCGVIFMSGASPLTFALEEAQGSNNNIGAALHDAGSHFPRGDGTKTIEVDVHPSHLSSEDISYAKARGAFERPQIDVSDAMFAAFVERFYPLYSIVDLNSFGESFKAGTLPWILIHSVCFIGVTFCDLSVVHRAGFKGRWHARRRFYDKAKLLFDIGYETNKIVLLQSVIMLSFWGPQMKSYWNPCSWVGFGVTIAESLGIYRINTSTYMDTKRRSLLKRLFWTLAVRDAYCAALLGRPFRLNIAQCDTEPLTLEDFDHDEKCCNQDHGKCLSHGHYQIQVSKLSLILRKIVEAQFGPSKNSTQAIHLHNLMDTWQSELPRAVSWWEQQAPTADAFAMSLKIIFHQQLILIHLKKRDDTESATSQIGSLLPSIALSSTQIAESAAQIISSTAFTIIANSMLGMMPHEIFSGFFVAGIVFYRGIKQPQDSLARLSRSALDNCQMVISEARERWDLANWVLRIFDFLLSSSSPAPETATQTQWTGLTPTSLARDPGSVPVCNYMPNMMPEDDILHSTDFGSPTYQMGSMANDFFLMSNYLPMNPGDSSFMSM
ncbi:uncharacterized protein PAC_19585 [Phialocephala subalpina]|uniref:Zn(2)-C6 fungal-type domain-containing protein n=1 Tax=Phialocephala subalpina TaxID=576137 RepID=A0A1L7XXN5_9HELO|nr:uncharacterized protein PAC_19585 [Phialocephala subalpina]